MAIERLAFGLGEVKFAADEGDMTFAGYGAVFGNVDSYGDVIAKGAFKETLGAARKSGQWPAMLSQHGGGWLQTDTTPIGIWTDMREDDTGLYVEGKLADTARGKEAYALLKMKPRPAYSGLSIGFLPKEWAVRTKPEEPRRTLKAVELLEVSLVTFPANPKARVTGVKSLSDLAVEDFREMEASLRMKGLSRADAVKAISGFKDWLQRDAGAPGTAPRDEEAAEIAAIIRRNIATIRS